MWSLILYFLFGIGQPTNVQPTTDNFTIQTTTVDHPNDGDGGDKGKPHTSQK